MAKKLQAESENSIIAGLSTYFHVIFSADQAIEVDGRLRLIYDYRGSDRKESLGQVSDPKAANYVSCRSASGIRPDLRTYSVVHSYKPPWSEEPECFMWRELLGPEVSLDSHVVEATFAEGGLPAREKLIFNFGKMNVDIYSRAKATRRIPFGLSLIQSAPTTGRQPGAQL